MESPDVIPSHAPDTPDVQVEFSIPKALRFNSTKPSEDKAKLLHYAIKHIFVPPRLPSRADSTPQVESALTGLVRDCAESFKGHLEPESDAQAGWEVICKMLATAAKLHDGELTVDSVKTAITSMAPGGEKDFAGLLLYPLTFSLRRCSPDLHCGTECCHHSTTSHCRSLYFHARILRSHIATQDRYEY
jgi:hypothetical protein